MAENEISNYVLQNITSIIVEESSSERPEVAFDRPHGIGKAYADKISGLKCKIIIVRFTIFPRGTIFYHNRKNMKRNVKVKLDLTKNRYRFLPKQCN